MDFNSVDAVEPRCESADGVILLLWVLQLLLLLLGDEAFRQRPLNPLLSLLVLQLDGALCLCLGDHEGKQIRSQPDALMMEPAALSFMSPSFALFSAK